MSVLEILLYMYVCTTSEDRRRRAQSCPAVSPAVVPLADWAKRAWHQDWWFHVRVPYLQFSSSSRAVPYWKKLGEPF